MEFVNLSKKAKNYWIFKSSLIAIVLIILALIPILLENELLVSLCVGIPVLLLVVLILVYPFLKYRFYKYYYNEEKVVVSYGVIFRHKIVIPVCQIQDLHVYEGPIMTLFKLKGVIFSTAGSNFELNCLEDKVAEKIVAEVEVYLKNRLEEIANEKI